VDKQALGGLKVVGFVTEGVGPITTRLLSMHGATVVQIESQDRPDGQRLRSPFKDNMPGMNRSYRYSMTNPGKYSMCLNMKQPDAGKVAERLVKWADVVVDNFRPGVLDKWHLSYEEISAIKPEIVMASLTARGHTGPLRTVGGYGSEIAGLIGLNTITGWPDRNPVGVGPYTDWVAPHFAIISILAAVDYRRRTGKGQYIDMSQPEAAIKFIAPVILDYTANKRVQTRAGNRSSYAAPHGVYRCKGDDMWCAVAVFTDSEWEAFCVVMGNPEWTREARFSTFRERKEHEEELNRLVEKWTMTLEAAEVMEKTRKAGIRAGMLRTYADIIETDPQLNHRKHWHRIDQPEIGSLVHRGASYILSKTPYRMDKPAPLLGEQTEYVCRELLGMSDEEFIALYNGDVLK
jgi:benzylsuccinate CoA-transferase BbsF subunit